MKSLQHALFIAVLCLMSAAAVLVAAKDLTARKELCRADLSGAPDMEVILSTCEFKPGDALPAHFHHGVETVWLLEIRRSSY